MNFDTAVRFVLEHEGGYVWHPADPGGETNFGISKRAYPNEDIRNLTRERAIEIYRRDYWDALPDVSGSLRFLLFDFGVNAGVSRSIRTLQAAIGTTADGIFGPKSLAALNACSDPLGEFSVQRQMYYTRLPNFGTFGLGWTRRTFDAYRYALGA